MPRKKKTKEQKRKADERKSAAMHTHMHASDTSVAHAHAHATPTYVFSSIGHTVERLQKKTMSGNTIALVQKDLATTAVVSVSILVLQLVLFLLLKNHVLAIGFVSY